MYVYVLCVTCYVYVCDVHLSLRDTCTLAFRLYVLRLRSTSAFLCASELTFTFAFTLRPRSRLRSRVTFTLYVYVVRCTFTLYFYVLWSYGQAAPEAPPVADVARPEAAPHGGGAPPPPLGELLLVILFFLSSVLCLHMFGDCFFILCILSQNYYSRIYNKT